MGDDVWRIVDVVELEHRAGVPVADQEASHARLNCGARRHPQEGFRATRAADRLGPRVMPFEQMLDLCVELGIRNLEIPAGGQSSAPHLKID